VGYRVLVLPDEIRETTAGGIVITETIREEHGQAQCTGSLVAVGPDAWAEHRRPWAKLGDRVLFARHGGLVIDGQDGKKYRMLNDEQITGLAEPGFSTDDVARIEKRRRTV